MAATIALAAKLTAAASTALLAAEAPAAASGDTGALYASITAVLVALIGGAVAIITSRNKPAPSAPEPQVRYIDPPSSMALPQALSELYEDALERAVLWEQRARDLGWEEGS